MSWWICPGYSSDDKGRGSQDRQALGFREKEPTINKLCSKPRIGEVEGSGKLISIN